MKGIEKESVQLEVKAVVRLRAKVIARLVMKKQRKVRVEERLREAASCRLVRATRWGWEHWW